MTTAKTALTGSVDIDAVTAAARAVLDDAVTWFPVRHHSPTAALHLRQALLERRPKLLFLEAPQDAQEMVPHLVDPQTKPPVALYVSYRDDDNVTGLAGVASPAQDVPPRFSLWFPFMAYSPEYVALKTCAEIGCEVVFFDLPRSALIEEHERAEGDEEEDDADVDVGSREATEVEDDDDDDDGERGEDWDAVAARSDFYKALREAAGYRSFNECWDALFEDPAKHASWQDYRKDLAAFCAGVRATTPTSRVERDGTVERERCMWQTLNRVKAERGVSDDAVFVVCGGFHLFLDRDDATPPPARRPGTHYVTVAPYSSFRVSELSGYGAGNRAPAWYGRLFDACAKHGAGDGPVEALLAHVVAVLQRGRRDAAGLSSADAIAVAQHARMLAALRGRPRPSLDDVRDALVTCCVKGRPDEDGAGLLKAMAQAEIGSAVGRVTTALGQLPLVHDFYAQVDALGLGDVMGDDRRVELTLDLRKDDDKKRSAFLHRLAHLSVPLGKPLDDKPSAGALFAERWALSWSPKIEDALIEKNLYGDAVETAAVALLEEELARDESHAGRACERLVRSLQMELPGLLLRLEQACGKAVDEDQRFTSLADAVAALLLLERHTALASTSLRAKQSLQELLERAYGRACFLIPGVADVSDDEQPDVLRGLSTLAEALLGSNTAGLDPLLFQQNLRAARSTSTTPYLQGVFQGLLTETRADDAAVLAAAVSAYAKATPAVLVQAGPFLDGVMSVSRTSILLGAQALVAAVDDLLRAADPDAFKTLLPLVRHAFERLHERQRDALAGHVVERYGLDDEAAATLTTSSEALLHLARIDARVASIMEEWSL